MVEPVRQRSRQVDAHAAQPALAQRQVQVGLGNGRRVEWRGVVRDAERDRLRRVEERDLDVARPSAVAMLDDVADELVDRLDEVSDRLLVVRPGRPELLTDERPDAGQGVQACRDPDRRGGQLIRA